MSEVQGLSSGFGGTLDDLSGIQMAGAFRVTRERFATQSLDSYGRPVKQLAERLVIDGQAPQPWVVAAPGAYRSLPAPQTTIAGLVGKLILWMWRCLMSLLAGAFLLAALPALLLAGFAASGRSLGGALMGVGVWALFILVLSRPRK